MSNKIIVIPDVHGRTFWKEGVKAKEPGDKIIFLGDYLDPYENTHQIDQLDNLEEIINLKKSDPDNVILLLGNHDRHYMPECKEYWSRYDFHMPELLKEYNISFGDDSLFKIIHQENINEKKFIFSHAGIHRKWLMKLNGSSEIEPEQINMFFFDNKDSFYFDRIISFYRGGEFSYGSIIWADVREFDKEEPFENTVQIFGHTQLVDKPINIDGNFYCLDVRRPFIVTSEGAICELDGKEVK